MSRLSSSAKQRIVEKALNRNEESLSTIAKRHNIALSTLGRWLKCYREDGIIKEQKGRNGSISVPERFTHLLATASLNEKETGIYCRENGLYSFQLTEWKELFMNPKKTERDQATQEELKALRAENKRLKQEVRRKDSALAETTALLVLKKKADLIWGDGADD